MTNSSFSFQVILYWLIKSIIVWINFAKYKNIWYWTYSFIYNKYLRGWSKARSPFSLNEIGFSVRNQIIVLTNRFSMYRSTSQMSWVWISVFVLVMIGKFGVKTEGELYRWLRTTPKNGSLVSVVVGQGSIMGWSPKK